MTAQDDPLLGIETLELFVDLRRLRAGAVELLGLLQRGPIHRRIALLQVDHRGTRVELVQPAKDFDPDQFFLGRLDAQLQRLALAVHLDRIGQVFLADDLLVGLQLFGVLEIQDYLVGVVFLDQHLAQLAGNLALDPRDFLKAVARDYRRLYQHLTIRKRHFVILSILELINAPALRV